MNYRSLFVFACSSSFSITSLVTGESDAKKFFDALLLAAEIGQSQLHSVLKREFLSDEGLAAEDPVILAKIRQNQFPLGRSPTFSQHLYSVSYVLAVLWPVLEWAIEHDNSLLFSALTQVKFKNKDSIITEKTLKPYSDPVSYLTLIDYYNAQNIKNLRSSGCTGLVK